MQVYLLLILCVLFWSANFIIGRSVSGIVEPIELAFFRWGGVFIVILPFLVLRFKKIFFALKSHFGIMLVLSVLGISAFNTLLYIGLQDTTATNALLINSSIPILILLLSFVIFKTPIRKIQILGIVLSTLGVCFLVLKGDFNTIFLLDFNQGDFWVITSSLCWATYSVLVKLRPPALTSFEFFMAIVTMGVLILFPFYLFQGYSWQRELWVMEQYYLPIMYVAFFPSLLSYYLWHKGIAQIGAEKTGQFTHLMPIFGSFLAYVFLKEHLEFYHLGGIMLIGCGIYLSLFIKKV